MNKDSVILSLSVPDSALAAGILTSANTGQFTDGKKVVIGNKTYTFKTTLSIGPAVPNEVLLGIDADDSLANLVLAINGGAGIGTKYSTGTVAHTQVTAGAVTTHTVTVTAKSTGFAGNAIASTTDEAKLSWDFATLSNGVGGVLSAVWVGGATGTIYSDVLDVGRFEELMALLNVLSHIGAGGTLDVTIQISADGITWTDGDAMTQVTTADTQTIKRATAGIGKYVRVKIVLGGTTPKYKLTLTLAAKQ